MCENAWRVSELLRWVYLEASRDGDLGLATYAVGLSSEALQFVDVVGEPLSFAGSSVEEMISEAVLLVSEWDAASWEIAEFLILMDDLRTGGFRRGALA